MNTMVMERSVLGGTGRIGAVLLLVVLLLTNTHQVKAQAPQQEKETEEDLSECVDEAFAEYNSCLMDSRWWFSRLICDLDWEADMVECGAEQVGQIKGAWEAH